MRTLVTRDFNIGVVQAVLFTDPDGFSLARLMKSFFPKVPTLDGDPQTIPDGGMGMPPEVPRVFLQAKTGPWKCQIAPARFDLFWTRTDGINSALEGILSEAAEIVKSYRDNMGAIAYRTASIVTRYATHEDPGLFLARHFCQERWHAAPLNRPQSFELHSHKSYNLRGFSVNSWLRAKSGMMTEVGKSPRKVVLAEQDLNTLTRTEPMSNDEVSAFFAVCPAELDYVFTLYFPEGS